MRSVPVYVIGVDNPVDYIKVGREMALLEEKYALNAAIQRRQGMFVSGAEGGSTITVTKEDLLTRLKANLVTHRNEFQTAFTAYRKAAEKALIKKLREVRHDETFDLSIPLPEPSDHSDDYERIIAMLEMCTEEKVFVSEQEFSQYVLDNWHWKTHFIDTNASYAVQPKARRR
jgi:hypothetical protein